MENMTFPMKMEFSFCIISDFEKGIYEAFKRTSILEKVSDGAITTGCFCENIKWGITPENVSDGGIITESFL